MITASQIRAARALLGLSQSEVAERAGISVPSLKRAEAGSTIKVSSNLVSAIRSALEAEGAVFISAGETTQGGPGVRLKQP
ncbi:helix-turn-helix domain-containing protein [Microvirga lenta]|uniref:helix-turn-helix domain-containing protein n=1 Tax=Microvirga lenta TaxID=2881337 RepID=UPI001CFF7C0C|nr:helix-turn-helix transcriptional regulator [Microvirga lenta]MCB5176777.1 helix-turn-helix transcriptional regulator [Microvirga lenta]